MNYAAYGIGQGLSQGMNNNQLVNAVNTASLIQYRRDQQRLQNRYADIAQQRADVEAEKWGMESQLKQQELEQKIFELEQKQNLASGQNFVRTFIGAIDSQDPTAVNNLIQSDNVLKNLANQAGITSFNFLNQFSDSEIKKLGVAEGMNPRDYVVANRADGTKTLFNARALMSYMGVANQFTQEQIEQVFRGQQLSSLQQIGTTPTTPEGVEQAGQIVAKQRGAEEVYDPTLNSVGKVSQPTTFELKAQQDEDVQKILTALPNIQDTDEFNSAALTVMNKGSGEQKLTAAQNVINRALSQGVPLDQVSDTQIGKQSMNVLYSSLSKTDQKQYDELMKQMRANAKISDSLGYLSVPGRLDDYINDTTIASADTWVSRAFNKVNPTIKQDIKGFKNDVVKQKYQNVLNTMIKIISGSAVSNQEAERLRMELGDIASEAGVNAIIGLQNLTENLISELKVFTNSPTLKIFVQPQLQQFENILAGFKEIGDKFNLPTSKVSSQTTQRVAQQRESVKKQVADLIPNAK